jgi:SNF2 family DNA or RNA helicase
LNQLPESSMPSSTAWRPRSYQLEGVKLGLSQACAGLLYPPGGGKTSVMYMILSILLKQKLIKGALVICPIRPMYNVWPNQKDTYDEFKHLRVVVLHGPKKAEKLKLDADLYLVNPEGLQWLLGNSAVFGKLLGRVDTLVVDESTKFKNSQSARFKLLRKFITHFRRRYILTGTPTPKGLIDLFGQIYILDEGQSLGSYITKFRENYFTPVGYGGYDWQPMPGAADRIAERIAPLTLRVDLAGHVDLPELVVNDLWVDLPPDVRKQYKAMEDALMVDMQEGRVVAANAAVASSKCRQIANGGLFSSEVANEFSYVHTEKYEAIADLLEQLQGEPLLITYEFAFDRDYLAKHLKVPCISSGNAKKDAENIAKFSRGELPAVMGHPASISLGIDGLQNACHHIAMVGVTWSLQDYQQVIQRVHRSGSKASAVFVHRILAKDTVDERVLSVLGKRDAEQADFLKLLKSLRGVVSDERRWYIKDIEE